VIKSLRLTRNHNIVRNDPFFAIEMFENLIEFHSLAMPKTFLTYELPLEERMLTFADACDTTDFEETRAFYLVVEREEKVWLRRVVMSHDKLLNEEELEAEDLFSFDKPEETIDHAVLVKEKLYLKSEKQILIAKEGVVPFPQGLRFTTNLVYGTENDLKCLGVLDGVIQDVDIFSIRVTPDPEASGIGLHCGNTVLKVYPDAVDYRLLNEGYLAKKTNSRPCKGLSNCAFGNYDLFQDGV